MTSTPEHIAGYTTHARRGDITNAFRYNVDYVLIDPDGVDGPSFFSRNRWNLFSVQDRHHGGPVGQGEGVNWVREVLSDYALPFAPQIQLLTQPALFGFVFNPVSFWLVFSDDSAMGGKTQTLRAVIAEVTNTFGDRHSYLCHLPDFAPITAQDQIDAQKIFHVSPFQTIQGTYRFTFDLRPDKIAIRIFLENGPQGVIATLVGPRRPLRNSGLLRAGVRKPLGALRVLGLIYWQALKLKIKGAPYRTRPVPPTTEVSR